MVPHGKFTTCWGKGGIFGWVTSTGMLPWWQSWGVPPCHLWHMFFELHVLWWDIALIYQFSNGACVFNTTMLNIHPDTCVDNANWGNGNHCSQPTNTLQCGLWSVAIKMQHSTARELGFVPLNTSIAAATEKGRIVVETKHATHLWFRVPFDN